MRGEAEGEAATLKLWVCEEEKAHEGGAVLRGADAYDRHILLFSKDHPKPVSCPKCRSENLRLLTDTNIAICQGCGYGFFPQEGTMGAAVPFEASLAA